MANKIISNLTPKTSPAAADVLAIEDTEATKKIDYNALADAILNKITSKTYFVAGSTQTLISAIDALNNSFASKNYTVFNTTTLLTTQVDALPVKASYCGVISSYNHVEETGVPVNAAGYVEIYSESVNYKRLFFCPMGSTDVYVKDKSSNGWGDWVKSPTRSEVDALNSNLTHLTLPVTNVTSNDDFYAIYDARANGESFRQRVSLSSPVGSIQAGMYVLEGYRNSANYGWMRLYSYSALYGIVSVNVKNNGSWGGWFNVPTRGEIDALNNSMTKIILSESLSVPKDSSAIVTLPSKTGSFLCAWRGTNAVWRGLALITKASTSDGICTVLHSNMSSVSESGNVLTFTNQHSSNDQTYYIRVTEIGN